MHKLRKIEKLYDVIEDERLAKLVNFKGSYAKPTHRWFRYREGFSPELLDYLDIGNRLYDPFCGCGTALIEASRLGIDAIGTDVNPLAVFIAKTKTANYSNMDIDAFEKHYIKVLNGRSHKKASIPEMPLIDKLFQEQILSELLRMKSMIEDCPSGNIQNLLKICWLNILEPSSNFYKEGNGIKYRNKKRMPGKYETLADSVWVPRYFGDDQIAFVRSQWETQCRNVLEDLRTTLRRSSSCKILKKSCVVSNISEYIGDCDTALFSPPYANRFDYFEAFKVELWMGGFVKSQKELRHLRGTSVRNNLTVRHQNHEDIPHLESLMSDMDATASSVRMGIKDTLRGYFTDMYYLGENLKKILSSRSGKAYCVVGNSAYAGVIIPTDLLVAEVFEKAGLKIDQIKVARHLTVSSQQRNILPDGALPYMRESIICASA